jgi:hypothetical protein
LQIHSKPASLLRIADLIADSGNTIPNEDEYDVREEVKMTSKQWEEGFWVVWVAIGGRVARLNLRY